MIQAILAHYDLPQPLTWACLGNAGGFSGSTIWKVSTPEVDYCLRRWPEGFDRHRLDWIHRVLRFARANGCAALTVPIATRSCATVVHDRDDCWELCLWAAGTADYAGRPNSMRLQSAIGTIARFHQAAARFQMNFARSENLRQIIEQLRHFGDSVELINQNRSLAGCVLSNSEWRNFCGEGGAASSRILAQLQPLEPIEIAVQPVIRDLRDEHFFFDGNQVCGIIDFGAMQIDTVACDLARMLGSMAGRDRNARQAAIEHYSGIRPLLPIERRLIEPMIDAGALIGVLNWMRWLHVEHRQFGCMANVRARVSLLLESMRDMR